MGNQNMGPGESIISIPKIIIYPREEVVKGQGHRNKSQHTIKAVVGNNSQSDDRVIKVKTQSDSEFTSECHVTQGHG